MITRGALIHSPKSNLCYAYDRNTLHIRIKVLKGEVQSAWCRIGDPFSWDQGGGGGNLEAQGASGWHHQVVEMTLEAVTDYHDVFFAAVKCPSKRARYAFILEGRDEKLLFGERRILSLDAGGDGIDQLNDLGNYFCFPYISGADQFTSPKWVNDTVWYHIFPDRFCNGDTSNDPEGTEPWGTEPTQTNYMGGDLQGVIDRLDYLVDLGVTGLHFCPIFKGLKNHRYQTLDYFQIDPIFGNNSLFKTLVDEAHARGIKIMLDGVFNHMASDHAFFKDVVENGTASPYFDWFYIDHLPVEPGGYETFAYASGMPRVNFECPAAVDYFLKVGTYWVETYDIDAWRLDVGNEVSHDFWRAFRKAVRAVKPDLFILGEIWHDASPWLVGDQYDGVMNYPLMEACALFFARNVMTASHFMRQIDGLRVQYPKPILEAGYNLLDSHDTSRFLTMAGGDTSKLLMAYAFLYTFPGSPAIFYGDEVGVQGEKTDKLEDHRRCMVWDESKWQVTIRETLKQVAGVRKTYPAFKSDRYDWVDLKSDVLLAFYKDKLFFVFNTGASEAIVNLQEIALSGGAVDLLTHQDILEHALKIPAKSFRILECIDHID